MVENIQEQSVGARLRELNIDQLVQVTNNFLSFLESRNPEYVPNTPNLPALSSMARCYFEEYRPLLTEWGRRQNADNNYQQAKHFPITQTLQGQMPDDLRQELNELQRRESGPLWNPQVDAERLFSLQKIDDFYRQNRQLPFPWLDFCLKYREEIGQIQENLRQKKAKEDLLEEEARILTFLEESGVEKIWLEIRKIGSQ